MFAKSRKLAPWITGCLLVAVAALYAVGCSKTSEPPDTKAVETSEPAQVEAVTDAARDSYPLDFCLVTGDKLGGEMGEEIIDHMVDGRLVRFCCKGCIKDFDKSPEKYLAMLDDALAGKEVTKPEGS